MTGRSNARTDPRLRVLLVGEGALSHGSFLRRTASALADRHGIATDIRIVAEPRGLEARLVAHVRRLGELDLQPLRWRLRDSWHARRALRADSATADVALVNTQSCALLAVGAMRRLPTVLSIDMTGRQFAQLGFWGPRGRAAAAAVADWPVEALERRAFGSAAGLLAWTEWTARSLRDDYGVPEDRIAVVHPGIDVDRWDVQHRDGVRDAHCRCCSSATSWAARRCRRWRTPCRGWSSRRWQRGCRSWRATSARSPRCWETPGSSSHRVTRGSSPRRCARSPTIPGGAALGARGRVLARERYAERRAGRPHRRGAPERLRHPLRSPLPVAVPMPRAVPSRVRHELGLHPSAAR